MGRLFVTGDTHGYFRRIRNLCKEKNTTIDDIVLICGDAGINYHLNGYDVETKQNLAKLPITVLILHGNHEERAWNVTGYTRKVHTVGNNHILGYSQEEYPNLIFLEDFLIQRLNDEYCLFLGGAYSVDKFYRVALGHKWFPSEQMSVKEMKTVLNTLSVMPKMDYVFSHTCPYKYIPVEAFLPSIDQSTVDQTTEKFLDAVEDMIDYDKWICAHWHIEKEIDKVRFIFEDVIEIL